MRLTGAETDTEVSQKRVTPAGGLSAFGRTTPTNCKAWRSRTHLPLLRQQRRSSSVGARNPAEMPRLSAARSSSPRSRAAPSQSVRLGVIEPLTMDPHAVAVVHKQDVGVVRPMMGRAHRETVPDGGQAFRQAVRHDVSCVKQWPFAKLADAAAIPVGTDRLGESELGAAEPWQSSLRMPSENTVGDGAGTPPKSWTDGPSLRRPFRAKSSKPASRRVRTPCTRAWASPSPASEGSLIDPPPRCV